MASPGPAGESQRVRVPLRRPYTINSIQKAVRVLQAFTKDHPERSVSELSRELGWHKAVVHKILLTLQDGRLLQRDPSSRRYRLGPGIMELAGVFQSEEPLIREGTPLLRDLMRRSGHTAAMAVLDGMEVLYIAAIEGAEGLKMTARVGDRRPAHATASGKVLLADLPPDVLDRLISHPLPALTPHTIVDPQRLRQHLEAVRLAGYALNVEERIAGMVGVAAPVRDHHGTTVAAVSVGFARHLHGDDAIAEAVRRVIETANELSRRLGAPPDRLVAPPGAQLLPV
ncbi:MAG: IclR family transcriptional regulator [Armatimonadota bacterium]|nr:IclR family transcriptional regulator [Armatimonadota bacterium]MDR7426358.1 IclR family transcriptional regulator [Armatimonadota bacterium]MDR7463344.1 IclR family transcriptional regulator [Armatimonadota bacterium]MDR7469158.1 IclR family transcriptional regulator [Armatimonadota bacterium]MDR7474571.1 IclR family transcriptional regulator [Armatimonadota bacterium]